MPMREVGTSLRNSVTRRLRRSRTESITNCMLDVASMTSATSRPTLRSPRP